ncbi:hypothetical protein LguiA_028064 [Lonicera macranthoides]
MKLEDHDLEIIKAVAQAWHAQSSNSRSMNDFEAHRLNTTFKRKPSRFSLEAIRQNHNNNNIIGARHWDLHHSLFDAYEIVSVSKRLDSGLVLDHQFSALGEHAHACAKRRKESKNSLRSLLKL